MAARRALSARLVFTVIFPLGAWVGAETRIEKWLDAPAQAGEASIWVGDNYSLAQAKADVRELLDELRQANYELDEAAFDVKEAAEREAGA